MIPHAVVILFVFAFGACVGSFLNVVVYRLPKAVTIWDGLKRLMHPPSHCPKCDTELAWKDNVPVFGWLLLRGRCRYCQAPISARYPIVEAITGGLFVFYYVGFFMLGWGPCIEQPAAEWGILPVAQVMDFGRDWPVYALYMVTISALLAASLIDAELFIIPLEIPWTLAVLGVVGHGWMADPTLPGNLIASPLTAALGAGGAVGLIVSIVLLWRGWLMRSFAEGDPLLDVDRKAMEADGQADSLPPVLTRGQVGAEMVREILFLLPPLILAGVMVWLTSASGPLHQAWMEMLQANWIGGVLGALYGALVGGLVVWAVRILGTLAFGREAMGLGDVHLMFGVGAVIGAGAVTVAFFVAPFFGIVLAVWMLMSKKGRELPFGPYLSLGTGFVMLFYCPIAEYLHGGVEGLMFMIGVR